MERRAKSATLNTKLGTTSFEWRAWLWTMNPSKDGQALNTVTVNWDYNTPSVIPSSEPPEFLVPLGNGDKEEALRAKYSSTASPQHRSTELQAIAKLWNCWIARGMEQSARLWTLNPEPWTTSFGQNTIDTAYWTLSFNLRNNHLNSGNDHFNLRNNRSNSRNTCCESGNKRSNLRNNRCMSGNKHSMSGNNLSNSRNDLCDSGNDCWRSGNKCLELRNRYLKSRNYFWHKFAFYLIKC